jgi:DNA-binding MarR family transcriptional regulator
MEKTTKAQLTDDLINALQESTNEIIFLNNALAASLGLNTTDFRCVNLLMRYGPVPAGKLAELTGLSTGAITSVVDRLEKAGYVKRLNNTKDRRTKIIKLVENKQLAKMQSNFFQNRVDLMESYSNQELEVIIHFTKHMVKSSKRLRVELSISKGKP